MTGPVTPEQYRAELRAQQQARPILDVSWIDRILADQPVSTEHRRTRRRTQGWTWSTTIGAPRDVPDLMPIDRTSPDDVWRRCGERLPLSPTSQHAYACSRVEGHTGRHACGTGAWVAAVWSADHRSAQDVRAAFPAPPRRRLRPAGGAS